MEKSTFRDKYGDAWSIEIVVSDVDRVRKRVVNNEGKPIDLLDMSERGDYSGLTVDRYTFPTVVFWLLYDQVMERFSLEEYDADHAAEYEKYPEEKRISTIQKAANWFASRIGGDELEKMAEAFEGAMLNFMSPKIRDKLKRVLQKRDELIEALMEKETLKAENEITAGLDELLGKRPPSLESTSPDIRSDSSQICFTKKENTTGNKSQSKHALSSTVGSGKEGDSTLATSHTVANPKKRRMSQ